MITERSDNHILYTVLPIASLKSEPLSIKEISILKKGYEDEGRFKVLSFARELKIVPFIAHLYCRLQIDVSFWEKIHRTYEKRNRKLIEILDNIFSIFENNDVNKVFVYENFGALLASKTCIGCFASGDVDLYADSRQKKIITSILKDNGFIPKTIIPSAETIKTEYFNPDLFETGFGINVMWKPMARTKIPFYIKIENCIEWNKLNSYRESNIKYPNIDALMYLCLLHISIHSYLRKPSIKLYYDIDKIALENINWNNVFKYAVKDHTLIRIFTAALLSKKMLGTNFPEKDQRKLIKKYIHVRLLINYVYDKNNNNLKKEPSIFKIILIEILSSDINWLKTLARIIIPSKKWITENYNKNGGTIINGYLKYLYYLLGY